MVIADVPISQNKNPVLLYTTRMHAYDLKHDDSYEQLMANSLPS